MKSSFIYERLRNKFIDNKYVLENSYIFDWESDFFYMTTSGYFVELEVKVSKSDFFADFKKVRKHKIIDLANKGAKTILDRTFDTFEITYEEKISKVVDGKRVFDEETGLPIKIPSGKPITRTIQTNSDIEGYLKGYFNTSYKQLSCGVEIRTLPKCPHKFAYVCPKGLISKDEVPDYAGLYYVSDSGRITEVKRTPFIHKNKINLDKILLDKFYYKYLNCKK